MNIHVGFSRIAYYKDVGFRYMIFSLSLFYGHSSASKPSKQYVEIQLLSGITQFAIKLFVLIIGNSDIILNEKECRF